MKTPSLRIRKPNRRVVLGSNALLFFAFLVAAVLVAGSILQHVRAVRVDLTQDDIYTLSPGSAALAKRLDAPTTVTLYFNKDLPAPLEVVHRDLRDLLEEYRRASDGRLTIVDVDPSTNPEALATANRLGIQKTPIQSTSRNKTSLETAYLAIGVTYKERDDLVLPLVTNMNGFEYDFSALLKRAMTPADAVAKTVRFASGHGELAEADTNAFRRALREMKQLAVEDLEIGADIPAGTSILVLNGSVDAFSEEQRKAIDRYILGGGKLLVFADGARVDTNLQATPASAGLAELLAPYGVTLGTGIVGDLQSMGDIRYSNGTYLVGEPYPYFPRILRSGMSTDSVITRQLDIVTLRWPTQVRVTPADGVRADTMLTTGDTGFSTELAAEAQPNLLPGSIGGTYPPAQGPQPLAVALWGALPSAFEPGKTATDARMIVIGDSDLSTNAVAPEAGNSGLLLNSVDWLLQDDDLIEIRSKQLRTRTIEPQTPARQARWTWGNLLLPPLLIVLAGIVAWRLRRR